MKKKLLFIFIFKMTFLFSQNAYYDALKLKEYIQNGKFVIPNNGTDTEAQKIKIAEYFSILNQYYGNSFSGLKQMHDEISRFSPTPPPPDSKYNPFLYSYMSPGGVQSFNPADHSINESFVGKVGRSIGSTPVTNLADGMAKFLIKRSKQELIVTFFDRFPEFKRDYPEFEILFPNASNIIANFESWEYANIINTLREAFDKDLKNLLLNVPKIASIKTDSELNCKCNAIALQRIKDYHTFLTSNEGIAISASLLIGSQLLSGNKVPTIINTVASAENLKKIETIKTLDAVKKKNIISTLAFVRIISNALRSNDINKSYVTTNEINALLTDNVTRDIFFGLLYQQLASENVTLINGSATAVQLKTVLQNNVNGTKTYIQNFIKQSTPLADAIEQLKEDKKRADANLEEDWALIFQSLNDFIPTIANVEVINPSFQLPDQINQIVEKSQSATAIAHDIAVKNYSAAIVGLLNELTPTDGSTKLDEFKKFIIKYGSFAANMVQAKNSDEVESAIESLVLPVGSASIKKKTSWNIALNAYLGGFYGNEYLADKAANKWAPISGVYAPIGITVSKGINDCKGKNYGAISGFLSIIDLGAIASYRLQDSTTEKLPEVTLQNIFAPGIGLVYGFKGFPVSVGYTYQLGPELRKINETETTTSQVNRRWQFFIAVDIPLLNLYTKSKPK